MIYIILAVIAFVSYSYICVKGYEDAYKVGGRHKKEQIQAMADDLLRLTESMPEFSKRRFRENIVQVYMDY